jgi:methylated-DNA-[protein]-cysteine S-methyltransferase
MIKRIYIGAMEQKVVGTVCMAVTEHGLAAVGIGESRESFNERLKRMGFNELIMDQERLTSPLSQMSEYLDGARHAFDIPIDWSVLTPFHQEALRATLAIPYGQTRTYAHLARQVGRPRAARAVGRAEATNPMPVVIPCHRVIGSDGKLHGYGAGEGLKTKAWLLELEGR